MTAQGAAVRIAALAAGALAASLVYLKATKK